MKLHIITIVLDGMPFISFHYPILRQLKMDWHWWVVEGVARPEGCTSWCNELEPRLSEDGTTEYLGSLTLFDRRVTRLPRAAWPGKAAMFNRALEGINDDYYILMQIDSDEIWRVSQIEMIHAMLCNGSPNCCHFRCRYFVGPDIVVTSRKGFGNHEEYEWKRAWRVEKRARFLTHEPPVIKGFKEYPWVHRETQGFGLVFDHFAYSTREQVAFKQQYYTGQGNPNRHLYACAAEGWEALQQAAMPVEDLSRYLPWVGPGVTVDRIQTRPVA